MPPDINTLLEECREKTTALVEEIEQYRRSRELNQMATEALEKMAESLQKGMQVLTQELNQKATDSLEKMVESLNEAIRQLSPFTDLKMRRFQLFVFVALIVNFVLLVSLIILQIMKPF
jgi:CRISPR/Cas system CSM-associated protein Csm2 small subunit